MTSVCDSIKRKLNIARENLQEAYEALKRLIDEEESMHRPLFRHIAEARKLASKELEALETCAFEKSRSEAVLKQLTECLDKIDSYGRWLMRS